jgi:hypothetical protein
LRDNTFCTPARYRFQATAAIGYFANPNPSDKHWTLSCGELWILADSWGRVLSEPRVQASLGFCSLRCLDDPTLMEDLSILDAARGIPSSVLTNNPKTLTKLASTESRWVFDDPTKSNYELPIGDRQLLQREGWLFTDNGDVGTLTFTSHEKQRPMATIPIRKFYGSRKTYDAGMPRGLYHPVPVVQRHISFDAEPPLPLVHPPKQTRKPSSQKPSAPPASPDVDVLARLHRMGKQGLELGSDGNCFYRVLSWHCYGDESYFMEIRRRCADCLEKHRALFAPYVPTNITFDEFVARTRTNFEYITGDVEILACAKAFDCQIHVYSSPSEDGDRIIRPSKEMFGTDTPTRRFEMVHLWADTQNDHVDSGHYRAVVPLGDGLGWSSLPGYDNAAALAAGVQSSGNKRRKTSNGQRSTYDHTAEDLNPQGLNSYKLTSYRAEFSALERKYYGVIPKAKKQELKQKYGVKERQGQMSLEQRIEARRNRRSSPETKEGTREPSTFERFYSSFLGLV